MRALVVSLLIGLGCASMRGAIWGEVVTPVGPIANVRVDATRDGRVLKSTTTDTRGRFQLKELESGNYEVVARVDAGVLAPGTSNTIGVDLAPGSSRKATLEIVSASLGAPISGVLADQYGRPVPGTAVCATGESYLQTCTHSNFAGRFTFEWLPNGDHELFAKTDIEHRWYGTADSTSVSAGSRDVIVRIQYLGQLSGMVVDEKGNPVNSYSIGDTRWTTSAFATRAWSKPSALEFTAEGFATELVALPERDQFGDLKLGRVVLTRGVPIRGRVVDATTGEPVSYATVTLPRLIPLVREWRGAGCEDAANVPMQPQLVHTKNNGEFELKVSRSEHELAVLAGGYRDAIVSIGDGPVLVKLDRGAIVEGRILDDSGKGVARAHVSLTPEVHWAASDEEGRFRFSGLESGSYVVTATGTGDLWRDRVDATVGKTVKLELKPVPESRLRVLGSPYRHLRLCSGECPMPSSPEQLQLLFEQSVSADIFSGMHFSRVAEGHYTLFSWRFEDRLIHVERQPIVMSGRRSDVAWKPEAFRTYARPADFPTIADVASTGPR